MLLLFDRKLRYGRSLHRAIDIEDVGFLNLTQIIRSAPELSQPLLAAIQQLQQQLQHQLQQLRQQQQQLNQLLGAKQGCCTIM